MAEQQAVYAAAQSLYDFLLLGQSEPPPQLFPALVAKISEARRYFPHVTAPEIAHRVQSEFQSRSEFNHGFTIWDAFDYLRDNP